MHRNRRVIPFPAVAAMLSVGLLVALLAVPTVSFAGATSRAGHGELRVATSPTVASQVTVGGLIRNTSGVTGLELPVGTHELCFRAVAGYVAPPCEDVTITEGAVTSVTGTFEPAGTLIVTTEPTGVGGAIVIDSVERDLGPMRLPIAVGDHEVCFSAVAGWTTPACRTIRVAADAEATAVGTYTTASDDQPLPPPAPTTVSATHGDRRAVVTWTEVRAADTPVTGYRLTVSPGGRQVEVPSDVRTATATGLTNGVRYRVSVRALSGSVAGSARDSNVVVPKPVPPAHGFVDVHTNAYFDAAVRWLRAEGITEGAGGPSTFAPQRNVSRAQMAAFLWRMHDAPGGQPAHGFRDVATSSYYEHAVRWLRAEGITMGTGSGARFGPEDLVTRGQMAAFLWRSAGSPRVADAHGFSDVPGDAYYAPAVRWLAAHEITSGQGSRDTFAPARHVTRAQMAAFLHRMASDPAAWEGVSPIPTTVAF